MAIKSKRFHNLEALSLCDLYYEGQNNLTALVGDYATFLAEFGRASLFEDHRDVPILSVYPLKSFRRHTCENGENYINFGFRGQQSFFFDEGKILSGDWSGVYVVNKKFGREIAPSFSVWFRDAYEWAKLKYSKSKWNKIVTGPKPFSMDEVEIVESRKKFKWEHIGFSKEGDAIFEVENQSLRRIPYLTIGIRDKNKSILVGAIWIQVENIEPGCKGLVVMDCYKNSIPPNELEPFDLPAPIPEKRELYREFMTIAPGTDELTTR